MPLANTMGKCRTNGILLMGADSAGCYSLGWEIPLGGEATILQIFTAEPRKSIRNHRRYDKREPRARQLNRQNI